MKIYGISGLGADKRVFSGLHLHANFECVEWIQPMPSEGITDYAKRLTKVIEADSNFVLLGVSFGGLIAIEMCKFVTPKFVFLISSAEVRSELNPLAVLLGKLNLMKFLPSQFFKPPKRIVQFIFGAQNKKLLNEILDDTDPHFVKWALNELMTWENTERLRTPLLKIIGTSDWLFPPSKATKSVFIDKGGHFIIADYASELSEIINVELSILNE